MPTPTATGRRTPNGGYRTRHGFAVAPGCFRDGVTPAVIEDAVSRMISGARRCSHTRMPPYTTALFNGTVSDGARVTCDPSECGDRAGACAPGGPSNRINFKNLSEIRDSTTWFHELLHVAGVDNQCVELHNSPTAGSFEARARRDEVFFWQLACLEPGRILDIMRGGDRSMCSTALHNHSSRPNRIRHHTESIRRTCQFFLNYLSDERALDRTLSDRLYSEVFSCDGSGLADCPSLALLNASLDVAGLGELDLPTAGTAATWVAERCGTSSSSDDAARPWQPLFTCTTRLDVDDRLRRIQEKVAAGALTPADAAAYRAYLTNLSRRTRLLYDSRDHDDLIRRGTGGQSREHLAGLVTRCREASGGAPTEFCRRFEADAVPRIAGLLARWD